MSATPEEHLEKARFTLNEARRFLTVSPRIAAREGYMAAFHAAEALILARTGRIAKTHKGVNIAFALLAREEPRLGEQWASFVGGSYEIKQDVDYGVGPAEQKYGIEEAQETLASVDHLIAIVTALLNG